jgi:hypothetical protein
VGEDKVLQILEETLEASLEYDELYGDDNK